MFRIWPRFKAGQSYVETIKGVGPMGQSFVVVLNQFCRDSSWVLLLRNSDLPINKQVTAIHIRGIALTEFRRFRFSLDSHKCSQNVIKMNPTEGKQIYKYVFAFNVYAACKKASIKVFRYLYLVSLYEANPQTQLSDFLHKKTIIELLTPNCIYIYIHLNQDCLQHVATKFQNIEYIALRYGLGASIVIPSPKPAHQEETRKPSRTKPSVTLLVPQPLHGGKLEGLSSLPTDLISGWWMDPKYWFILTLWKINWAKYGLTWLLVRALGQWHCSQG